LDGQAEKQRHEQEEPDCRGHGRTLTAGGCIADAHWHCRYLTRERDRLCHRHRLGEVRPPSRVSAWFRFVR
jgi:hypothetical protein